ncbi:hypothetical protein [Burkholderia gladioli]|uniref:hypothetical protein n=1 Tax=Burkholderia gladioli TaxID=28095 RepID=UPI00163E6EC0|nr:hypothetical protein [Burkholderia gladioli]
MMNQQTMHHATGHSDTLAGDDDRRYLVLRSFPPGEPARRYEARVATGSNTPATAIHRTEFFVLDLTSDPHAAPAMVAYAHACAATRPDLAADMLERFDAGDTAEAAATAEPADSSSAALALSMLRARISDDAHAMTFQTLGQYRASLLAAFDSPALAAAMSVASTLKAWERAHVNEAIETLRAALAAFPKTASQVCLERALLILQGRVAIGGGVSACPNLPAQLHNGEYIWRDTGPLETGDGHE